MGSAKESNEFPWDAGKERKGHFPPSNSEQCHKQLNESSSNEFQLKDIFSERSQVHLHSRQVKVETFGKSTQRTLTPSPHHAAQIVECSQFWVRASFYWGLISLSASQLSIFTFFVFSLNHTQENLSFLIEARLPKNKSTKMVLGTKAWVPWVPCNCLDSPSCFLIMLYFIYKQCGFCISVLNYVKIAIGCKNDK